MGFLFVVLITGGGPKGGGPKFRSFFHSLSLWRFSCGIFAECEALVCTFGVLGLSWETQSAPKPPGFTTSTKKNKSENGGGPASDKAKWTYSAVIAEPFRGAVTEGVGFVRAIGADRSITSDIPRKHARWGPAKR